MESLLDISSAAYEQNNTIFLIIAVLSVLVYSITKYIGINTWATVSKVSSIIYIIISIFAAIYAFGFFSGLIGELLSFGGNIIVSSAFAGTQKAALTPNQILSIYIVGGIYLLMFITFLVALFVIFLTKRDDGNENKIAAADSIIKTFGGFFIGVATSFANQNIV